MSGASLKIVAAGPALTIQDRGRPGYLGFGVSAGGAMDRYALAEGQALLGAYLQLLQCLAQPMALPNAFDLAARKRESHTCPSIGAVARAWS